MSTGLADPVKNPEALVFLPGTPVKSSEYLLRTTRTREKVFLVKFCDSFVDLLESCVDFIKLPYD